jgi:hypothetical protein
LLRSKQRGLSAPDYPSHRFTGNGDVRLCLQRQQLVNGIGRGRQNIDRRRAGPHHRVIDRQTEKLEDAWWSGARCRRNARHPAGRVQDRRPGGGQDPSHSFWHVVKQKGASAGRDHRAFGGAYRVDGQHLTFSAS